jgi:hypothetical protein
MDQAERCKTVWDPYWGAQKLCSKTLSFTMEPAEIADAEQKIGKDLQTELRYEMKVALVALPDGGYNVVTLNRRPRTDLHGMCDPSYVAWNVAFFTANSRWKSRLLQIWTKPYDEGWYLSTSGSRNAIRQGKARSGLGWLGVVEIATFRKWLDKSFRPLPSLAVRAEPAYQLRAVSEPVRPPFPVLSAEGLLSAVATHQTLSPTGKGLPTHSDAGAPLAATLTQPPHPRPTPAQTDRTHIGTHAARCAEAGHAGAYSCNGSDIPTTTTAFARHAPKPVTNGNGHSDQRGCHADRENVKARHCRQRALTPPRPKATSGQREEAL